MSFIGPLFHVKEDRRPMSGTQAESQLADAFGNHIETFRFHSMLLFTVAAVGNFALCGLAKHLGKKIPFATWLVWIPLGVTGFVILKKIHRCKAYKDLFDHLHKNGSVTKVVDEIDRLYPNYLPKILLDFNFAQLGEARKVLGADKVKGALKNIQNWWSGIDRIFEATREQRIEEIKRALSNKDPLILFALDQRLFDEDRIAYRECEPLFQAAYPGIERIPCVNDKDSISLHKRYIEEFAEGSIHASLSKGRLPDLKGIEAYLAYLNGDEGVFDLRKWLVAVHFCDTHRQVKLMSKLDAVLEFNFETLTEEEHQELLMLKPEIQKTLPKTFAALESFSKK